MLEKIEKVIARDIPYSNIYTWHKGYTSGMKKSLGWGYSDAVFYVHDGFSDIMRTPKEHLELFKLYTFSQIDLNSSWIYNIYSNFDKLIDEVYDFYNSVDLNSLTKKEIANIFLKYEDYVDKIVGPYVLSIWLPIWCENDQKLNKKYAKEIEESVKLRIKSENIFPKGDELVNRILELVKEELNLRDKLEYYISRDELLDYLGNGKIPDTNLLVKRSHSFIYSKGKEIIVEEDLSSIFAKLGYDYKIEDYSNINELKGTCACKGKIKVKVNLIMTKLKINEIKDGEILVTSMTTPEYLPAMKKASAFITNEGGITCHAAIVARELNKPCIIGTKIATKVLKDGMKVEVDADEGVVRVLG